MEYYGNNDYRDYLLHYGVKGMKWGKHLFGDDEEEMVDVIPHGIEKEKMVDVTPHGIEKEEKMVDVEVHGGELSDERLEQEALRVIRGEYGNGAERKHTLGDNYEAIQAKVNEILKGSKKVSSTSSKKTSKTKKKSSTTQLKTSVKKDGTPRANESAESKANREKAIQQDQMRGMLRTIAELRRRQRG